MGLSLYRRHFIAAGLLAVLTGESRVGNAATRPPAKAGGKPPTILIVGDSLSAEYGIQRGSGWVALLEQRLQAEKMPATVVNASISGDTTSGGRSRLGALLAQHHPTHVVIELGANDAMRGLPLQLTQDNLTQMTQSAQKSGARVMLVGMQMPPNYGRDYGEHFAGLYERVAKGNKAAWVPFLLRGVADAPDSARLFQADRIHPKEEAHPIILNNVWPELKKLLK